MRATDLDVVLRAGSIQTGMPVYEAIVAAEKVRWTPPVGQFGGLDKLGSGCRQAASLSISGAQYASSGERPASVE
jgi:hypothetical protein